MSSFRNIEEFQSKKKNSHRSALKNEQVNSFLCVSHGIVQKTHSHYLTISEILLLMSNLQTETLGEGKQCIG